MTTTSDRCDCPYPDPMTYGGPNPLCPEHGDPDAILASGRYTDRKGREWRGWVTHWHHADRPVLLSPAQMRLKIVRERHRVVCPGLRHCTDHPVAHVYRTGRRVWSIYGPEPHMDSWEHTHEQALDAARRMTGEQK